MISSATAREIAKEKIGSIYEQTLAFIGEKISEEAKAGKLSSNIKIPKVSEEVQRLLLFRLKELGYKVVFDSNTLYTEWV